MTGPEPNRSRSTVQPPDPDRDYGAMPVYRHRNRVCRYRAHGQHGPWYFSSGVGRFNLASPRGTLNTASSPEVAVREYLGIVLVGDPAIPATAVAGRRVSELEIPRLTAADFTSGQASAFGIVPGDIAGPTDGEYRTTRAWAAAMEDAGYGGIQARSRFGGGDEPTCLFVFGDEGEHELGDTNHTWPMRETLDEMAGFRIDRTPSSVSLVVDP